MDEWTTKLMAAINVGPSMLYTVSDVNRASEHIVQLLSDASRLLEHGSAASSAFLAITALEEIGKANVGMFRRGDEQVSRRKDPLFNHGAKHQFATGPTVRMGTRLPEAIGEERLDDWLARASNGGLVAMRENCLYFDRVGDLLRVPAECIHIGDARELLLIAVEAFDDALVGITNRSYELSDQADAIFSRWSSWRKS